MLTLAGVMFLLALVLGVWKYRQIVTSDSHSAHVYVDIAHRAALLYSFALLLVATFVSLSGWSATVNIVAGGAMAAYFFAAVGSYVLHAALADTDNQFRDGGFVTHAAMVGLIVTEIGGWLVLLAGFLDKQVF